MVYVLFGGGILITSLGQLLLKYGVSQTKLTLNLKLLWQILTTPALFLGFALYGLGAILWLFILKKLPLSVAYPAVSISYVIVVVASFFFFKEPLTANKIVGMIMIIGGILTMFYRT